MKNQTSLKVDLENLITNRLCYLNFETALFFWIDEIPYTQNNKESNQLLINWADIIIRLNITYLT